MPAPIATLAIEVPWSPNITEIGGFTLTWHGLFTAVGILVGVQLALWVARRSRFDEDVAYTLALIGVPCGIIGARLLFVAEHWDHYGANPAEILAVTEGGLSIWGGILGGFAGPLLFGLWRGYPMRRAFDIASIGMIAGMGIGRLGDMINGEHVTRATDLPWGVIYTHPASPAFAHSLAVGPHHPATTYEMLGDFAILGVLFYAFWGPFRLRPGMTFLAFLVLYAVMRFFLSELRLDSQATFVAGLTTPQLVSALAVLLAIPVAIYFWRRPVVDEGDGQSPRPPGRVEVQA